MPVLLATALVALAGFSPPAQIQFSQTPPKAPVLKPLSAAGKIAAAKAQLHLPNTPTGIVDSLTLTVRNTYADGKGYLDFSNFQDVNAGNFPTGWASGAPVLQRHPNVFVYLTIAQAHHPHVATFYFKTYAGQTVKINSGGTFPEGSFMVPSGEQNLPFAFTPAKNGKVTLVFSPRDGPYAFFKVEVDVLN
jgi:hypothetical protein